MEVSLHELKGALLPLEEETGSVLKINSHDQLRSWLVERISILIDRHFEHLLRVLYLIDVDEEKVRTLIAENGGVDAPAIIADLILKRQSDKIRSRNKFKPGKDGKYFS